MCVRGGVYTCASVCVMTLTCTSVCVPDVCVRWFVCASVSLTGPRSDTSQHHRPHPPRLCSR